MHSKCEYKKRTLPESLLRSLKHYTPQLGLSAPRKKIHFQVSLSENPLQQLLVLLFRSRMIKSLTRIMQ